MSRCFYFVQLSLCVAVRSYAPFLFRFSRRNRVFLPDHQTWPAFKRTENRLLSAFLFISLFVALVWSVQRALLVPFSPSIIRLFVLFTVIFFPFAEISECCHITQGIFFLSSFFLPTVCRFYIFSFRSVSLLRAVRSLVRAPPAPCRFPALHASLA